MNKTIENHRAELRSMVGNHLEAHPRLATSEQDRRDAAVVLALVPDQEGRSTLLLTRRATHLRRHGGQWALPGGRLDEDESFEAAALRELREEIGVVLAPDHVLGRLDDYLTRSGFRIVPVVAWSPGPVRLVPDPGEVAAVYRLPLSDLDAAVPTHGKPRGPMPSLGLLGTRIFAPTAALLFQFVEVALRGRATRVDRFGEPFFAWR